MIGWARRVISVDQDGQETRTIRLQSSDGAQTWHTWKHEPGVSQGMPFGGPEAWVNDAEQVLNNLAEHWPKRNIPLLLTALDQRGVVVSSFPLSVQGQSAQAEKAAVTEQRALADTMTAQAEAMRNILESSNVQVQVMSQTVEQLGNHYNALLGQSLERDRIAALESDDLAINLPPEMVEQFKTLAPQLIQALIMRMAQKGKPNNG